MVQNEKENGIAQQSSEDNTTQGLSEEVLAAISGGGVSLSGAVKFYKNHLEPHPSNMGPAIKSQVQGAKNVVKRAVYSKLSNMTGVNVRPRGSM
jgi:hypothetical protein